MTSSDVVKIVTAFIWPVIVVVIHEHGHRGIGGDVAQPLQVGCPLGLVVDREVERVAIEREAERIENIVTTELSRSEVEFQGFDFSLAPFPERARSIGTALERLGIPKFGGYGSPSYHEEGSQGEHVLRVLKLSEVQVHLGLQTHRGEVPHLRQRILGRKEPESRTSNRLSEQRV